MPGIVIRVPLARMNYTEMITAITARDCPYIICRKTAITH